jgi:hypothetical protein
MMMTVRPYVAEDKAVFERLAGRPLPDLDSPLAGVRLVGELNGEVAMVLLGRATMEMHLGVDHVIGKPSDRWALYLMLDAAGERAVVKTGLEDAHLHLALDLTSRNGYIRRIERLGWRPEPNAWWRRFKGESK